MYLNLFVVAQWVRYVYKRELKIKQEGEDPKKKNKLFRWRKSTWHKIWYVILVNINYVILACLVLAGLARMDLYHATLLIIFVWATFYPAMFQKYSKFVLLYTELFIVLKYLYTLFATKKNLDDSNWLTVIGISTKYDPAETREFFRYVPKPINWTLVILLWIFYRRAN